MLIFLSRGSFPVRAEVCGTRKITLRGNGLPFLEVQPCTVGVAWELMRKCLGSPGAGPAGLQTAG